MCDSLSVLLKPWIDKNMKSILTGKKKKKGISQNDFVLGCKIALKLPAETDRYKEPLHASVKDQTYHNIASCA